MESNQGHMDFQSIALPPELRYLVVFAVAKVVHYTESNEGMLGKQFSIIFY